MVSISLLCVVSVAGFVFARGSVVGKEVRGERSLSADATSRIPHNAEDMVRKVSRKSTTVGIQEDTRQESNMWLCD